MLVVFLGVVRQLKSRTNCSVILEGDLRDVWEAFGGIGKISRAVTT